MHLVTLTRSLSAIASGCSSTETHSAFYKLPVLFEPSQLPEDAITSFVRDLVVFLSCDDNTLDWATVYSCLINHPSQSLVEQFVAVQYGVVHQGQVRYARESAGLVHDPVVHQGHVRYARESAGLVHDPVDEAGLSLLSLSELSDRETAWRDLVC